MGPCEARVGCGGLQRILTETPRTGESTTSSVKREHNPPREPITEPDTFTRLTAPPYARPPATSCPCPPRRQPWSPALSCCDFCLFSTRAAEGGCS